MRRSTTSLLTILVQSWRQEEASVTRREPAAPQRDSAEPPEEITAESAPAHTLDSGTPTDQGPERQTPAIRASSAQSGSGDASLLLLTRAQMRTAPQGGALAFLRKTLTIAELEVRKLRHDPSDIIMRTVQPALWLLVFGETFSRIHVIATGHQSYLQFLCAGHPGAEHPLSLDLLWHPNHLGSGYGD